VLYRNCLIHEHCFTQRQTGAIHEFLLADVTNVDWLRLYVPPDTK